MLVMLRVAVPVLERVRLLGLLVVFNACEGNVKDVGERLAMGAVPVPERLTV
jgi:hypothetical protein